MAGNSRPVSSNQSGIHARLEQVVRRHLTSVNRRPCAEHTRKVFEAHADELAGTSRPLIFDSCCGVGESTAKLAARHPDALVLGLDKSATRLGRHGGAVGGLEAGRESGPGDNYRLLRVDLNDFWRLAADAGWRLSHHYLLYPNPWPKAAHLQRRWHASPAFIDLLRLGGQLTLRSNWRIYLEEFAAALAIAGHKASVTPYLAADPLTPFERKYRDSGQVLWQLECDLDALADNEKAP